ncbi:hypothetical protein SAMN04488527_16213 [Aliiroseovarius crassostreae]|uniref:hypothetical protein n=1 Tax=Aliiroseovarius crassostreae TaxID=154981 RepID=UPI0008EB0243|nr:hypothetical protein [Aliiroseovarius crassostreae]SFU97673.1 hypothetical protein SAMN04488527_16213 [Aliiroseovarius crassostreae]
MIMRVTGPERATLAFGAGYWIELKGFANSHVSKACEAAARKAVELFAKSAGLR